MKSARDAGTLSRHHSKTRQEKVEQAMNKKTQKEHQTTDRKKLKLLESLQLPKDVCLGALRVTLTGSTEAWVENYRGLLEYSEEAILLQGKTCQVCFEGTGLTIDYYTNEDMKISGCIQNVRYL